MLVEGWLLLEPSAKTHRAVFANGTPVGGDWVDVFREDLLKAGLGNGHSGFRVIVPIEPFRDPKTGAITAPQVGLRTSRKRIRPAKHTFARQEPRGGLDGIADGVLMGWVDTSSLAPNVQPTLTLNGTPVYPVQPNMPRPDVVAAGMAFDEMVGFAVPVSAILAADRNPPVQSVSPSLDNRLSIGLVVEGQALGHTDLEFNEGIAARIESYTDALLTGWAVRSWRIAHPMEVDILLDGLRYATVRPGRRRSDLRRNYPSHDGGGFECRIPYSPTGKPSFHITIAIRGQEVELGPKATISVEDAAVRPKSLERTLAYLPGRKADNGVAIIVPIHNAVDDVRACLTSLVEYTTGHAKAIVIDDKSTDNAIRGLFDQYTQYKGLEFYTNDQNLGFTKTVNRGIALAGRSDVILLNSDTIVTPRWLEGLRVAAYSEKNVGTVTAISNNAGAFSVPESGVANRRPIWMSREEYARALRQAMPGLLPRVPTGNGFCLYVRRDCLDDVGILDEAAFPRGYGEENDFCMRAARKGWTHVIDDKTLIYHTRSASFGTEKSELYRRGREIVDDRYPEYQKAIRVFETSPEILTMRYRARMVCAGLAPRATGRRRILFVISTTTGGTPQTNADLMKGLADEFDTWLLRCDSRVIELSHSADMTLVERSVLDSPINIVSHRSQEYDDIVSSWLARYSFDLIHIRHISWHSLGLIDSCDRLSIPVVFSFHDFYTICPTVKLLDENLAFCGGTCTPGDGPCAVEIWPPDTVPPLKHRWITQWRQMMDSALRKCAAFVTTSESARATLVSNFPFVADRLFTVIPHGRALKMRGVRALRPPLYEPMRILVPGNINDAKGARAILALRDSDKLGRLEFHIMGNAVKELAGPRIIRHGAYERDEFASRADPINAYFGAIFSIWPETYCHTLTELWSFGLPVLAFDFGVVADRIRETGGGWLVPHDDPRDTLEALLKIAHDANDYQRKVTNVLAWQQYEAVRNTIPIMAERYVGTYSKVLNRRTAFPRSINYDKSVPLVGTLSRGKKERSDAFASTHVRVWEWTRNAERRPIRYMRIENADICDDERVAEFSAIIIQRDALDPIIVDKAIANCRSKGTALVVEIDDDLLNVPPSKDPHGRYTAYAPALKQLLREADSVIVSTNPLRTRMAFLNPNIKVIENRLSGRLWFAPLPEEPPAGLPETISPNEIRILYMGSDTHDDDLELLRQPVERLKLCNKNVRFFVIAGARNAQPWFEVIERQRNVINYPAFVPWFRKIAESMDIAVAPLCDGPFNETKSPLKCLDYAAAGLFGLYSDVPTYRGIIEENGFGRLVPADPEAWFAALKTAINEFDMIKRTRAERMEHVASTYCLEDRIADYDANVLNVIERIRHERRRVEAV